MFFGNSAIDREIFRRSASIIRDVILPSLSGIASLLSSSKRWSKSFWKIHRRRSVLYDICRIKQGAKKILSSWRATQNSTQVRQLDSACNLIFTSVPLKLGHYCRIRFTSRPASTLSVAFIPYHYVSTENSVLFLKPQKASVLSTHTNLRPRALVLFLFSFRFCGFHKNVKNTMGDSVKSEHHKLI